MSLLVLFNQPAAVIGASSATTDGQDVSAAGVGVLAAASSATTDSADTTAAGVDFPAAPGSGVVLLGGGGAVKGWTKPEKGSYWEALLSPPQQARTETETETETEPAAPVVAKAPPNQIAIAATDASRQAMRRSVQAAAQAAQMQALAQFKQALTDQQAADEQTRMNDDDDEAILALLLA